MSSSPPPPTAPGIGDTGPYRPGRSAPAPPRRFRVRAAALLVLAAMTSAAAAPGKADAAPGRASALSACGDRNGWVPQGVVAPAIPGITKPDLIRFADLDGDGDDERLLLDEIGGVREWRNDRDGRWSYRARIAAGTGYAPDRIKFADLNGDGKDDYLVVKDNGAIDGWINEGGDLTGPSGITPGWKPVGQIARGTGAPAGQVFFADLDGDGDDDYLTQTAPQDDLYAWRNEGGDRPGHDGWVAWGKVAEGNALMATSRADFGDFDCDGRDDRLYLYPSSVLLSVANGGIEDGVLKDGHVGGAAGTHDPMERIMFAELNGDGRIDYLTMDKDGAIVGYLNDGGDR
ncbi:VCBS repeat-containing protein [Streptomyces sp. LP05-1]|uniref:VCBS repeat-containing protein n=1 Tax=Streptomyces pyxinae TaxID=2970734 RepID=A0ABT2CHU0_9ACTN|nr:VCBS repeat-containing protein [Streptomyces sp. LP05-1]MCS0636983.1 VCBS repeat-containing protein [Streptomyces sp. LP05-1]